jgi:two-component system, chemotaxis family, protein-glutamate methylesterase/glutaminase
MTTRPIQDAQEPMRPAGARRLRVMIVEDSRTIQTFLTRLIGSDPRFEVVAIASSGEEALRVIHRAAPDVISMDIRLPGIDGFEATRRIMTERPTPIVVIAASVGDDDLSISMNALAAGALSIVEKPPGATHGDYEAHAERICTQLAIMSQLKVVRQYHRGGRRVAPSAPDADRRAWPAPLSRPQALGIVASTGGPNAVLSVLRSLPAQFPVPILLVQHMCPTFTSGFIRWLNGNCPQEVVEAKHGMAVAPGRVYAPPAETHLRLRRGRIVLDAGSAADRERPSGNILFQSMADDLGPGAVGVLLTGMGTDGAQGLAALRGAGGYTITEDESTAVVYGMPAAAVALGGSCESLPLHAIGPRIRTLVPVLETAA